MGAPLQNSNATKHGLRSSAVRFELGSLPPKLQRIERAVNQFRRVIEVAVQAAHGEITTMQAARIQTVCRYERHAALALRYLRLYGDTMSNAERLSYSKSIAEASAARDKGLALLGLDATAGDLWGSLYGPDALSGEPIEPEVEPTNETAADAKPERERRNHGKD